MSAALTSFLSSAGGAAAIQGGSSLASTALGGMLTARQNRKQRKWAAKQAQILRDWEAEQAQINRDWQAEQWQRQFDLTNEYNSPSAVKQRLADAGYNPYFFDPSSGNAIAQGGLSGSMPSASIPNTPYQFDLGSSVSQVGLTVGKVISDYFANKESLSRANLNDVEANESGVRAQLGATDLRSRAEYNDSVIRLNRASESSSLAISALNGLKADAQHTMNKYLDQNQQADLMIKSVDYFNKMKAGILTKAQIQTELSKDLYYSALARGKRIDNRVAREVADSVIGSVITSNRVNEYEENLRAEQLSDIVDFQTEGRNFERFLREFEKRYGKNRLKGLFEGYVKPFSGIVNAFRSVSGADQLMDLLKIRAVKY